MTTWYVVWMGVCWWEVCCMGAVKLRSTGMECMVLDGFDGKNTMVMMWGEILNRRWRRMISLVEVNGWFV
ncbi:MAG: hypothetical protein ACTSUE_26850 [Promethearchaeota archaeon]